MKVPKIPTGITVVGLTALVMVFLVNIEWLGIIKELMKQLHNKVMI